MQEQLFRVLFDEQDVTWQNIIYEAVRTEQMDPWDIDLFALSKRFLEMVRHMKEMDFKISGKIILAAAILLRLKSNKLVADDISELDRLIAMSDKSDEEFYENIEEYYAKGRQLSDEEKFRLIPKTPQPRKRKVSVYDLVEALEKALEVNKRRAQKHIEDAVMVEVPEKKYDISAVIQSILTQILDYLGKSRSERITFSELVKSGRKEDKIYTFIPLLHLTTQRKIDLEQEYHLAEIDIIKAKDAPLAGQTQEEKEGKKGSKESKAKGRQNACSKN